MRILTIALVLTLSLQLSSLAEMSLSPEEATKKIFPELEEYKIESHFVDGQEFKIFTVVKDGETIGWTVVSTEMGKINPITFLVGISKEGKVLEVYVLEFRDMFGAEVKRRSFLRQFQGKVLKNPLKVGRDIDAVTQATISSNAATTAVKKSLMIIEELL